MKTCLWSLWSHCCIKTLRCHHHVNRVGTLWNHCYTKTLWCHHHAATLECCEAIVAPEPCNTIAMLITLECYEIIVAPQCHETIVVKLWVARMFFLNELRIYHSSFQIGNLTLLLASLLKRIYDFPLILPSHLTFNISLSTIDKFFVKLPP